MKHGLSHSVRVGCGIENFFYACVNKQLSTDKAGLVGTVNGGTFKGDAVNGSLDNDILFGMQSAAQLMTLTGWNIKLFTETSNLQAILHIAWGTVITSGEDMFILHSNGAHLTPATSRTLSNKVGNAHKI